MVALEAPQLLRSNLPTARRGPEDGGAEMRLRALLWALVVGFGCTSSTPVLSKLDAAGVDAAGADAAGVDAAGVDSTGADASGVDAGGIDSTSVDVGPTVPWCNDAGLRSCPELQFVVNALSAEFI